MISEHSIDQISSASVAYCEEQIPILSVLPLEKRFHLLTGGDFICELWHTCRHLRIVPMRVWEFGQLTGLLLVGRSSRRPVLTVFDAQGLARLAKRSSSSSLGKGEIR